MATLALAAALVASCGGTGVAPTPRARDAVRIGSFNFAESEILAELYAQAIESRGIPVHRLGVIGSREVVEPALELGLVDVVPEYAGTMLQFVTLGRSEVSADTEATLERLRSAIAPRGLLALDPAKAQDRNAFVVHTRLAGIHRLATLSDLAEVSRDLTFGGPAECPERYFCLLGLEERYNIEFARFVPLPAGVVVADAIRTGEIDVGLLFSTDASLADDDLRVLTDDRGLQPAENVVPVVRAQATTRWGPNLAAALTEVSTHLDTAGLVTLNWEVRETGAKPELVAAIATEWLTDQGVIADAATCRQAGRAVPCHR